MKKIVISGATSMLGTALTEVAVNEGVEVYAIARPNTNRLERLNKSPLVHLVYGNLGDLTSIEDIPKDCDVFYHFAWAGTSKADRDDPIIQSDNIQYSLDAVHLAFKVGCRRFIGAGSQAEYGQTSDTIDENTLFAPTLSYGVAKYSAGVLSRKMSDKLGMEHVWGRIFSVYGPHDNDGTLIKYLLDRWNCGEIADIMSGLRYWNYLHERDAGRMFYCLGNEKVSPGDYLVANPESKRLHEYIEMMAEEYGPGASVKYATDSIDNTPGLMVNITKRIETFDYSDMVAFRDGVKDIINSDKQGKQKRR